MHFFFTSGSFLKYTTKIFPRQSKGKRDFSWNLLANVLSSSEEAAAQCVPSCVTCVTLIDASPGLIEVEHYMLLFLSRFCCFVL